VASPLSSGERALIAALAALAVDDYLRAEPSNDAGLDDQSPEPVPLPNLDRAA
jgi:hypothetical protein